MKRSLLVALVSLVVLAAGCSSVLNPHGKVQWVDYSVDGDACTSGECVLVKTKVRNSGNGTLAIGSMGVIALDSLGNEVGRNTRWVVEVLKPGEVADLRITFSGTLSNVSVVKVFLSSDPMSAFSQEDRLGELSIPVA